MTANHVEHEIVTFTGSPGAGGGSKEKPRRAGAWSYLTIRRSLEGLESLDASILSQSRNQAKRGPSKRPRRFRVLGEVGRNLSSAPMRDAKDFAGVFSKWT